MTKFFNPILDEIFATHPNYALRITFTSAHHGNNVLRVLAHLGLPPQPTGENLLEQIDRARALTIVASLLGHGLAYNNEFMTRENANRLAEEFLNNAAPEEATFYTNGAWDKPGGPGGYTSYSLGPSCLDGGIIILHSKGAACFWVEDDD